MKKFREVNDENAKLWDEIPFYKLGDVPDNLPDENPILYRCIVAKRALISAYEDQELPSIVVDILTDLRHLCDKLNMDFADMDRVAYNHYIEEKE